MKQKPKNHQNQRSCDEKIDFFYSPHVTYPDGFTKSKIRERKILMLGP
jgi:hypothetical protein